MLSKLVFKAEMLLNWYLRQLSLFQRNMHTFIAHIAYMHTCIYSIKTNYLGMFTQTQQFDLKSSDLQVYLNTRTHTSFLDLSRGRGHNFG